MTIEYYELKRIKIADPVPGEFCIRTAAVLTCGLCGGCIDGMGGPGNGAICVPCGDVVKRGEARTAIKWDERS